MSYYLVRPIGNAFGRSHSFYKDDPWLASSSKQLEHLADLCDAVRNLASEAKILNCC